METLNLDLLPDNAKKELLDYYYLLKEKYSRKKNIKKLPDGFYNPIEIKSYDLIASRDELYER